MKILILSLFVSFQIFSQDSKLLLLFDSGIIYNGSELITNTINRDMELGAELFDDVTFDNATEWSLGTANWAIAGGIATYDGLANSNLMNNNTFSVSLGERLLVSFAVGGSSGFVRICNQAGAAIGWDGTHNVGTIQNKFLTTAAATQIGNRGLTAAGGYTFDNFSVRRIWYYANNGNHSMDTSSVQKYAGSYSGAIIASAAGDGTTNTISLASTLFTAVTSGLNYRFQLYAYTSTANTTLTFKLGDIVLTSLVSTVGMNVINFDFKATASTTGNILLYLDKAATVYIDEVSLKSGS